MDRVSTALPLTLNFSFATDSLAFNQARALLEWHNNSHFCGHCGEKTIPKEAGRRRQCSSELCKKRIYPRVDPVGSSCSLLSQAFEIVI